MSGDHLMRTAETFARIGAARIVSVLTVERPEDGVLLAGALTAGGLTTIELALRTPHALDVIRAMKSARSELAIGAGTVLSPDQADAAKAAGADFALAPGLDAATVRHCLAIGLPFIPGVATASDKPLPDPIPLKIQFPSSQIPKIGFWPGQERNWTNVAPQRVTNVVS